MWGFADSGFEVNAAGKVQFRGARYAISGKLIPNLLPWAEGILGVKLDPFDRKPSGYPTAVPERVAHPALEAALAARLSAARVSSDPRVRLRHGHGHTQEDMWAIKHGALKRVPDLVVWPEDEAEVRAVLELVREHGACLIPYGGGTNVTDALRCPEDERRAIVSLDLRRMNRVLWIDPTNRTAADPGGRHRQRDRRAARPSRLHARPRARFRRALDARRLDRDERQRDEEEPLREHRGARALDRRRDAGRRSRARGRAA